MAPEVGPTNTPTVDDTGNTTTRSDMERQQWQQSGRELAEQVAAWIKQFQELFGEYQQVAIALLVVVGALLLLTILLAFLAVMNAIPLLPALMKLVGFGFTLWVIARYLLFADTRQELGQQLGQLRTEILGEKP